MNDVQQRAAARHFAEYWKDKGYEKGESQKFWLSLLTDVFGLEHAAEYIAFEDQVHLDHTSFIDGYIPETHVLIEQKSLGKDLRQPIRQSDGTLLKPIQQAQRYASALPYSQRPRWIVICNFECFHIYDMEHPQRDPEEIWLRDLPTQYHRLEFLVKKQDVTLQQEMEISIQAGDLVGKLYDALLQQYRDPTNEQSLKSLNALCVRLVFCLYAEDAGIFGHRQMFHDYLRQKGPAGARQALIDLFRVLDTPVESRDPYMDDDLAAFPYVNGGLFSDENIEIPRLNEAIYDLILNRASAAFDWSEISPTIFGAVFESTLNPETRRKGGMHYTSIENIHKVIDPLFLDELRQELEEIKAVQVERTQTQRLRAFQDKLAGLKFLDPAAGSGNFLTESYLCLRRLENEAIGLLQHGQISMGAALNPIKVSIGQFYGIEINDFAATVAKTALWIAESQMMKRTEDIVHMNLDFLPLKSYVNIVEGNALRLDWESVVPKAELNYIMGNPPFVGYKFQSVNQKADMGMVAGDIEDYGTLDYVAGWYIKASKYMKNTSIKAAFVSTNSISQGEHVNTLWKPLFENGLQLFFAHRTFRWDSEASLKAHVHCVIIGFALTNKNYIKRIWDEKGIMQIVSNINGYLIDAPNIFVDKRKQPWTIDIPSAQKGNAAMDNGWFILSKDEKEEILEREPEIAPLIKLHMSADDFLNRKVQYCIWLNGVPQDMYSGSKEIRSRLRRIQEYRAASNRAATKRMADYPMLFAEIRQPKTNYIMIPVVSSERRRYIPMAFLSPDIINSYASFSIPDATLYHFGVLESNVHMAWMRILCGRLKSDYRYSNTIVYNNFPWPTPTEAQKAKIEQTALAILDARALYPDSSLADLYDELTMPPELRRAHQANDRAVMEAYGMSVRDTTESSCVAELMRRYQALTAAPSANSH